MTASYAPSALQPYLKVCLTVLSLYLALFWVLRTLHPTNAIRSMQNSQNSWLRWGDWQFTGLHRQLLSCCPLRMWAGTRVFMYGTQGVL